MINLQEAECCIVSVLFSGQDDLLEDALVPILNMVLCVCSECKT